MKRAQASGQNRQVAPRNCIRFFSGLAVLLVLWVLSSAARPAGPSSWLHESLASAARTAASERSLALDPAVMHLIVSEGDAMLSLFCSGPAIQEKCKQALRADLVLAEVRRYVGQLEAGAPEVRRISANLANAIGHDLAEAGWPPVAGNDVGIVLLPRDAHDGTILLTTAAGKFALGNSVSKVLMMRGTYQLTIAHEGRPGRSGTVDVQRQARTTLSLGPTVAGALGIGRLDPPESAFCFDSEPAKFEGPVGMYNWGRATYVEPAGIKQANLAQTATRPAVVVRLDDELGLCRGGCSRALGVAFAQAIATWKVGCERCEENAMSILSVDGTIWVDARIANRLRAGPGRLPLDLRQSVGGEVARSAAPSLVPTRTAIYGFEQITGHQTLTRSACELAPDPAASWVSALQAGLCRGSWSGASQISPTMKLVKGGTNCGPSRDFLACGLPSFGIELSVDDVRYVLTNAEPAVSFGLGDASLKIDLMAVVFHEVGHWFGVPHFESTGQLGPDIMSENYGGGRSCVSGISLMMLNNASDVRWSYRVHDKQGLRRPAKSQTVRPGR